MRIRPAAAMIAALVTAPVLLGGAGAAAQGAPSDRPPPSWEALTRCAEIGEDAGELACYRAAMRAAGFMPTARAESERRRKFGLNVPAPFRRQERPKQMAAAKPPAEPAPAAAAPSGAPDDDAGRMTVQLSEVALIPPQNRLLLVTAEGAIWVQMDDEKVTPLPKPGRSIEIERNRFGGYFCSFDKLTKVRCVRRH